MSDHLANVQHAIPASSVQSSVPKSTITKRNAKPKKGLGAKKVGGLGGKKVTKADFEKLEKSAEESDQFKQRLSVSSATSDRSKDMDTSAESLRLAYQDITLKEKQNNAKLNKMDDRKKEQATRLGMGMGKTTGVSHSVDMITIDQVNPVKHSRRGKYTHDDDTFYDAFPSSKKGRRYKWDASDSDEDEDESESMDRIDFSYSGSKKSSSVDAPPSYTVTPIGDGHRADTNVFMSATTAEPKHDRQRSSKKVAAAESKNNDRLDKFQNASAISSDMLFGSDSMQETNRERMRKFEGQTAISSDDYFDRDTSRPAHGGSAGGIRDGVKEGVRSVAGRLSNMATDIASTLQDRYG